jgi:crotonobetainyl-CoA:carnitine CoA-transferase CaiB-like acyl-CoA transferase
MYRCADGAMLAVACENETHWKALAKCVGRPELAYTGDWAAASTAPYKGRLGRVLGSLFREDPAEVWLRRLEAHGVPARIAARPRRGPSQTLPPAAPR